MARGKRDLAGFGEVAGDKGESTNINNDANVNVNNNEINGDNKSMNDNATIDKKMDNLLGGMKDKEDLVLTGVYLQRDLAAILDKLGKRGGRGAKSRMVNKALRQMFSEEGLL